MVSLLIVGPAAHAADPHKRVLTDTEAAAALSVVVETGCSQFKISSSQAILRWDVEPSAAPKAAGVDELAASRDFRVDFTPYPRGLTRGDFKSVSVPHDSVADPTAHLDLPKGAKAPNAGRELALDDLQAGVTYRARVLALTERGWVASDEVMFRAAICPVDYDDEETPGGVR